MIVVENGIFYEAILKEGEDCYINREIISHCGGKVEESNYTLRRIVIDTKYIKKYLFKNKKVKRVKKYKNENGDIVRHFEDSRYRYEIISDPTDNYIKSNEIILDLVSEDVDKNIGKIFNLICYSGNRYEGKIYSEICLQESVMFNDDEKSIVVLFYGDGKFKDIEEFYEENLISSSGIHEKYCKKYKFYEASAGIYSKELEFSEYTENEMKDIYNNIVVELRKLGVIVKEVEQIWGC